MPSFKMQMKGGRMASGGDLRGVVERQAGSAFVRAGLAVQRGIQEASPVKRGTLRRSWNTSAVMWRGGRMYVRVGTSLVYARYQNTRTVNRGFVKRGYDGAKEAVKAQIQQGMKAIGEAYWVGK